MDITEIIKAVIGLLTALIIYIIAPSVRAFLSASTDKEKLAKWKQYVDIAVGAAEQLMPKDAGKEKKQFVLDWLNARGIEFDADEVDSMIEASVIRLHTEIKGVSA